MDAGLSRLVRRFSISDLSGLAVEDRLALFVLAVSAGAYAVFVLIAAQLSAGISEAEETRIFVLGWVLAPAAALSSVPVWTSLRRRFMAQAPQPFLALAGMNTAAFCLVTTTLNLAWQSTHSVKLLSTLVWVMVWLWPLTNVGAVWMLRLVRRSYGGVFSTLLPILGGVGFLNFVGFFPYNQDAAGQYNYVVPVTLLPVAVAVGGISLTLRRPENLGRLTDRLRIVVDVAVILLIVLTCFDASLQIQPDHQSFYLGPTNRILHGGSMLVDTFSQYGVLVINFLALMFMAGMPLTYQGFSLGIATLTMLHFSLVFVLLNALVRDRFYSILLLVLALLLGLLGTLGTSQAYASTGPLRFGLPYLLLLILYLQDRFPLFRRPLWVLELSAVAVASLWSLETFVYTLVAYLGICLLAAVELRAALRIRVRAFLRRMFWLVAAVAGAQALFALGTHVRSGALPAWRVYAEFFSAYSSRGVGTLPIEPWTPWIYPLAVYFVSLVSFFFRWMWRRSLALSPQDRLIFGLTLFGIAQYTYYLGRSHPNNLFHISTPSVLIAGFGLVQLRRGSGMPAPLQRAAKFVLYAASTVIVLGVGPTAVSKYQADQMGFRFAGRAVQAALSDGEIEAILAKERQVLRRGSADPQVMESEQLLKKYDRSRSDAAVILSAPITTEVLMASERAHRLPVSELREDGLSATIVTRILSSTAELHAGEVILVAERPDFYLNLPWPVLQSPVILAICSKFALLELERSPHGVSAMRLGTLGNSPSPYCQAMELLNK